MLQKSCKEKISIIVPVYNGEKYISRCLESLLNQTYTEYKVIVVDDGSTDGTLEIIKKYSLKNSKIETIHTHNYGVSHARNIGMSKADTKFVTFVDADDELEPNALQMLYKMSCDYEADILIMSKLYYSKDGELSEERRCTDELEIWEGNEIIKKAIEDHIATHSVYAKLYRKDIIKDVKFVEGKRIHEDSFFVFECFRQCRKVVFCDKGIYKYYKTADSASRSDFSDKYFDILFFAEKKAEIIREFYPVFSELISAILIRAKMSVLYNMCKTYKMQYWKMERDILKSLRIGLKNFSPETVFEKRFALIIKYHIFAFYKLYLYIRFKGI